MGEHLQMAMFARSMSNTNRIRPLLLEVPATILGLTAAVYLFSREPQQPGGRLSLYRSVAASPRSMTAVLSDMRSDHVTMHPEQMALTSSQELARARLAQKATMLDVADSQYRQLKHRGFEMLDRFEV